MKNKDNWLSALIWFGAAISVAAVGGKGARWPS